MFIAKNRIVLYKKYIKFVGKWTCANCIRTKSSIEPKTKAYSHTILAPKTNFPTRSNNAKKEEIQKVFIKNLPDLMKYTIRNELI